MPKTGVLLMVGFQRGVLRALREIGRPAFVLVPRGNPLPDAPEIAGACEIDLHGERESIAEVARELLGDERPAAVIAMAERTVLVSARLRELYGLAGNDSKVALRCADKVEMKLAMDAAGVPVAPWRRVGRATTASELLDALQLPIVIKPRRDSGGRGQSKLDTEAELASALAQIQQLSGFDDAYGWLAESWVEGVESSVESFVHAGVPVFQNPTEYYVPRHANILPAQLDQDTWHLLRDFATRALKAAGVERGISHMELFHTASGPVFGELAIRAPGGRMMTLLERAWGFDPWEASLRLELGEEFAFPTAPKRCSGVWVMHPGSGRVQTIQGLAEARAVPNIRRIALKVSVGTHIERRQGTGQDVGSIYAEAPNRDAVAEALTQARERLQFELG